VLSAGKREEKVLLIISPHFLDDGKKKEYDERRWHFIRKRRKTKTGQQCHMYLFVKQMQVLCVGGHVDEEKSGVFVLA